MEVVAASPGNGTPFHNHDVREWSRLDSLTGVLERARLETDHWAANTVNSSHKYNKVVDSRARSGVDGNLQQQARRKLEVFQSQVPGGRLQVIKTQTVSSSRWTGRSPTAGVDDNFEDLKLSLNPLDLTSEKSKASVGRSVGRRPPSRSRIRDGNLHAAATTNLHRVSRLCHQVHNSAVRQAFGGYRINEQRQNGDGVEIAEIDESNHRSLSRTKSTSSEDLHDAKKSLEDLEDLEQLQSWRRTSKIRRSLQYPKQKSDNKKPPDLPDNTGSVRKIREDLETGRRLSTALRGNNLDLDALDQILKSISNSSVSSSYSDQKFEEPEEDAQTTTAKKNKRDSFVTVESIQAVRDRLRRTSSPGLDVYKKPGEEIDDGIVTETTQKTEMNESRVKSYIYGMEKGKNISGTGSLESRSKPGNQSAVKNEDWFSRRKSYGFEQMHSQQETISSKNKRVESSTDSGICRSSEIVVVPTPTRTNLDCASESEDDKSLSTVKKYALIFEKNRPGWNQRSKDTEATTITIPIGAPTKNFDNQPWNDSRELRKNQTWSDNRSFENQWSETNRKNLENKNFAYREKRNPETDKSWNFERRNPETNKKNSQWKGSDQPWNENGEAKRHSIAVDELKYINNQETSKFKRTSLSINDNCDNVNESENSNFTNDEEYLNRKYARSDGCKYRNTINEDSSKYLINDAKEKYLRNHTEDPNAYTGSKFSEDDSEDCKEEYASSEDSNRYFSNKFRNPSDPEDQYLSSKFRKGADDSSQYLNGKFRSEAEDAVQYLASKYGEDSSKYPGKFKPTLETCEDDEDPNYRRQNKKVEFCKTEVHFAADSGRVNIVETDEKPPPTQNFRRRRRNSNLIEDFNRNGLPVLHFGDTSYEKLLFSDADLENHKTDYESAESNEVVCVTVNVNANYRQEYEEQRENFENEVPKGILKNKPIKPKPYILGDNSLIPETEEEHEAAWGVKLRPALKEDAPLWRSTVTVRNTSFDKSDQPEFQKLLKQLRPTSKKMDDDTKRNSDSDIGNIRILSPTIDTRRSSWSVADRIKQVEDLKWSEAKGYSTKVNFGDGEATVVENRHPTWPRREEYSKDTNSKFQYIDAQIESDLKHLKIDEDNLREPKKQFSPIVLKKSSHVSLKSAFNHELSSPYLVRSRTSPYNSDNENNRVNKVEDVNKKQVSMESSSNHKKQVLHESAISHKKQAITDNHKKQENVINHKKQLVSGDSFNHKKQLVAEDSFNHKKHVVTDDSNNHKKQIVSDDHRKQVITDDRISHKKQTLSDDHRKQVNTDERINHKKQSINDDTNNHRKQLIADDSITHKKVVNSKTIEQNYSKSYHQSRRIDTSSAKEAINRNKSPIKEKVARQPKKSEMAYFGVKVSPKNVKKDAAYSEKPDLVQCSSLKKIKENTPIYENVKPTFDSSILEELTKAADQILQAVNGYTDEEHHSKYTSEEEKREPLDTISETKSWKQKTLTQTRSTTKTSSSAAKTKSKQTSSNSSLDSISRECRKLSAGSVELKKPFMTKSAEQKQRKKVVNGESAKARRLQRASSREALLQSHGSSSEDLAANTVEVVRKPRLVKKTKSAQLTMTNGIEMKKPVKKREEGKSKHEERVPVIGLPEIRHKTAVSTIRSTAEKAASREKSKLKNEDSKKKPTTRKETIKGASSSTLKPERTKGTVNRDYSHRHTSVTTQKKPIRTTEVGKH